MSPLLGGFVNLCPKCNKESGLTTMGKPRKYCSASCRSKSQDKTARKKGKYLPCSFCAKIRYFNKSYLSKAYNKTGMRFCNKICCDMAKSTGLLPVGFKKKYGKKENHPYKRFMVKGKTYSEHRMIMESYLGRELEKWENVHHVNGNTKDNRIENLMVVTSQEHNRIHYQIDRLSDSF